MRAGGGCGEGSRSGGVLVMKRVFNVKRIGGKFGGYKIWRLELGDRDKERGGKDLR